ncbi:MAG TPA: hypothetical protein PKV72_01775 [Candidatus Peribacteria bacterium]|nr:hypothetical protein [Candidatus Peribacteria bacterium]
MQRTSLLALSGALLLSACGSAGGTAAAGNNPLLQIQHDEQLADSLANLIITKDPLADDASTRTMLEGEIAKTKESLAATQRAQAAGMSGPMRSEKEEVGGWALYMNNTLYTSSDFSSPPGLDLHLYVTAVVDPRDVVFPDITSIDLGRIEYPYGAMALPVHAKPDAVKNLRSVVLWDAKLKRLYGFAQLSARK